MADESGDEPPAEQPKYDQAFFLALAAKGKYAWNAWRRDPANKDVRATFAGIDFSVSRRDQIDFSGFEFGANADFSWCKWRGRNPTEKKPHTIFSPGSACFFGAVFGNSATFDSAIFGDMAGFYYTTFGDDACFDRAAFGRGTIFGHAKFGNDVSFYHATFGHLVEFSDAAFGGRATFAEAAFGELANFDNTSFKDRVNFYSLRSNEERGKVFKRKTDEKVGEALIALEKRHEETRANDGSGPDRFFNISFANARFDGPAFFRGRAFERPADFTNARFYSPPDFDAASHLDRIDFTGAHIGFARPGHFHWTSKSQVPLRLRALRKVAEETKNHDLERDLYIEERKAERGVYLIQRFKDLKKEPAWKWPYNAVRLMVHILWIIVMGLYWALADYGRSFARPAVLLGLSVPLFHWGYAKILAPLVPQAGTHDAHKYDHAVGMLAQMLALGNAVPFVGPLTIDGEVKKFLFCPSGDPKCPSIPPEGYQFLVLGQNLLSIILVFFIGLALRNYFKIK